MTEQLAEKIFSLLPKNGTPKGNVAIKNALKKAGFSYTDDEYEAAKTALIDSGKVGNGKGRGGSLYRMEIEGFDLTSPEKPEDADKPKKHKTKKTTTTRKKANEPNDVLSYRYDEKRKNNPHVGMVDTASDGEEAKTTWQYDPHLDPELQFDSSRAQIENFIDDALASGDEEQMRSALLELKRLQSPYLNWSGKAERTSFEVDTVSLHVHERMDPATILAAVQKRMQSDKKDVGSAFQPDLFHAPFENLPLREAINFYKHERDWANRLIAGDLLLIMNSFSQKRESL